jgi:regulator of PEP synthase PpsR (kinase-PPPase family)
MTPTLHQVSDSTGETVAKALTAALAQFDEAPLRRRLHIFVRSHRELARVMGEIAEDPGPVIFTLVDPALSAALTGFCRERGLASVDLLSPLTAALSDLLGRRAAPAPGAQHDVDAAYFARVAAIDFAMASDDGVAGHRFGAAEVILAGVSRTSKTPTCIYLACRGVKAANLPLVPGRPIPEGFERARAAGVPVIGLTIAPARLVQLRQHRLEALGATAASAYTEVEAVRAEVAEARLWFDRIGAPVIDVTRRSIEETAAAVMAALPRSGAG